MRSINNLNLIKELAENTYIKNDIKSEKLQDNKDEIEKSSSDTSIEVQKKVMKKAKKSKKAKKESTGKEGKKSLRSRNDREKKKEGEGEGERVKGGAVPPGMQNGGPMGGTPRMQPMQPMGGMQNGGPMGGTPMGGTMRAPMGGPMGGMQNGGPMGGMPMGGMPMGGMPMGMPMGMPQGMRMGMPMGMPMGISTPSQEKPSNEAEKFKKTISKNYTKRVYNPITSSIIKTPDYPNDPLQILPLSLPFHMTQKTYNNPHDDYSYSKKDLEDKIKEVDEDLTNQGFHVDSRQDNLNFDKKKRLNKKEADKGRVDKFWILIADSLGRIISKMIDIIERLINSRGVIYILAIILMVILAIMFVVFIIRLFTGGGGSDIETITLSNEISLSKYCKESGEPINLNFWDYLYNPTKSAKDFKAKAKEYFEKNKNAFRPLRNYLYTARGTLDQLLTSTNFNKLDDQSLKKAAKFYLEPPQPTAGAPGATAAAIGKGRINRYDNIKYIYTKYFFTGNYWIRLNYDPDSSVPESLTSENSYSINDISDDIFKNKLKDFFNKKEEKFTLDQNEVEKLKKESEKPINELNYIYLEESDICYLNFNEILYDYLEKSNNAYKLIDKYISLNKPKNFDIITKNNEDSIPPEIKKYKLDGKSLDDTNIITIPYKILYDDANSVFKYVMNCDGSYYKNTENNQLTNLYSNNPSNKCDIKA